MKILMILNSYQLAVVALVALCGSSACSIQEVRHDMVTESKYQKIVHQKHKKDGSVDLTHTTGVVSGKVGWIRFPLFFIPVVPVYLAKDVSRQIMLSTAAALKAAGYNADDALQYHSRDTSILNVHVNSMTFSNYTFFAPVVPTWGRIELTLRLETGDGAPLWEKPSRAIVLISVFGMDTTLPLKVQ